MNIFIKNGWRKWEIMITLCRKVKEYKEYKDDGNIHQIYYLNKYGQGHNLYGPACIGYYKNGNKSFEEYYIDGKCHRKNEAAFILCYENGNKQLEVYYINGKRHRLDGPAFIEYDENGNKVLTRYYLDGLEKADNNDNTL